MIDLATRISLAVRRRSCTFQRRGFAPPRNLGDGYIHEIKRVQSAGDSTSFTDIPNACISTRAPSLT
eukprot:scaffold114541_cov33-Tisochrysis_lutea.AAC.3